jgi:hypothetical protein
MRAILRTISAGVMSKRPRHIFTTFQALFLKIGACRAAEITSNPAKLGCQQLKTAQNLCSKQASRTTPHPNKRTAGYV